MERKKMLYESVVNGTIKTKWYIMHQTSPVNIYDFIEEPEGDCFGVAANGLFWKDGVDFPAPYTFEFSSSNDDYVIEEFASEYRHAFNIAERMKARFSIWFLIDGAKTIFVVDVESTDDSWGL